MAGDPLKVIYHCYGAAHSSVTAAAIHLNLLPRSRKPSVSELLSAPRYDHTRTAELGTPFFMGKDRWDNDVHILGRGGGARVAGNLLYSLAEMYGCPTTDLLLINALPHLSATTTIGGTLSRGLGIIWPGRALTVAGIRMCYFKFVKMVEETELLIACIRNGKEETYVKLEN